MEVKKIVEGMTAPQVAQVIDENFNALNGEKATVEAMADVQKNVNRSDDNTGVLSYPEYSSTEPVAVGDVRRYEGLLYRSKEEGAYDWDPEKWERVTLKQLEDEKISELGLIIGKPYRVTSFTFVNFPARKDGSSKTSGYFKGYQIDLTEFRDRCDEVSFRGSNYSMTSDIVKGIIIDDDGNVESSTEIKSSNSNSWEKLPLTSRSKTLWATYCTVENGGEVWEPEYVELIATAEFYTKKEINQMILDVNRKSLGVFLPNDIYAIQGKVTQIFFRGFVNAVNPYNLDIKVMCEVGKTYPRYYEVDSTTAEGDYPMKFEVRDDNRNVLANKEVMLHIIPVKPNVESINVLCVGASATVTGHWAAELKRMLAGDFNANFVGRKAGTSDDTVKLEATGGWSWGTFINSGTKAVRFYISSSEGNVGYGDRLTFDGNTYTVLEVNLTNGVGNIRCSGANDITAPVNPSSNIGILVSDNGASLTFSRWDEENYIPFFNNESGKIDFKSYADKYCGGRIDVIIAHLGVNSVLWEGSNIDGAVGYARQFIEGYIKDFPNGKVILSAIPMPDDGTNVYANSYKENNINRYGTLSTFMRYNEVLRGLAKSYSNVYWAPSDIFFDTDYGYPKKERNVNMRISSYKEMVGANGVHPVKEGSYMVADGIYPVFVNMIN